MNKFKYDAMMYPKGCVQEYNYGITDSFFVLETEIHVKLEDQYSWYKCKYLYKDEFQDQKNFGQNK